MATESRDVQLRNRTKVGAKFELKIKPNKDAPPIDVVGTVAERMPSSEARARRLTKSKRTGQFLVLNVPGHGQVYRFRSQVRPEGSKPRPQ